MVHVHSKSTLALLPIGRSQQHPMTPHLVCASGLDALDQSLQDRRDHPSSPHTNIATLKSMTHKSGTPTICRETCIMYMQNGRQKGLPANLCFHYLLLPSPTGTSTDLAPRTAGKLKALKKPANKQAELRVLLLGRTTARRSA
jgi:hypothetical protein